MLDEGVESLLARHRRVELVLPPDFGKPPRLPATWIAPQSAGRILRFTDTAHNPALFPAQIAEFFHACPPSAIYPLTLRELFITRVRTGRGDVRGKSGISR